MTRKQIVPVGFAALSVLYGATIVKRYYPIVMSSLAFGNASLAQSIALWYVVGLFMTVPLLFIHIALFRQLRRMIRFAFGFPLAFVALAALMTVHRLTSYPLGSSAIEQPVDKKYERAVTWNTLTSSRYRFIFLYPDNWTFQEDWEKTIAIANKFSTRLQLEDSVAQIEIYIRDNSDYLESDFATQPFARNEDLVEINDKSTFINVSGQKGIKFYGRPTDDFAQKWNLGVGPHTMEIVQFRGDEYTYAIIATYPAANVYTYDFKEDFYILVSNFSVL